MKINETHLISQWHRIINSLFLWIKGNNLEGDLARGSIGTFGLKIAYSVFSFTSSVILSHALGVAGYGVYAYALAWIVVLSVPSGLGFDKLIVRQVAVYRAQSQQGKIRSLLHQANYWTLIVSIIVAIIAAIVSLIFSKQIKSQVLITFWTALLLLPILNLIHIRQATMLGLGNAVTGQLPEMLIQPLLFVILLIGTGIVFAKRLSAPFAMAISVIAAICALSIGIKIVNAYLPKENREEQQDHLKTWAKSILPLVMIGTFQIVNSKVATLMLGTLEGPDAVGLYAVANRGAEYITFFMSAMTPSLAPIIANLYADGDMIQLQRIITKSTRAALLFSAPFAFGFIFFGAWFLFLFGQDFMQGKAALTILSVGQLFNIATGSVAWLLFMTGYEKDAALSLSVSLFIGILLNAFFIPRWGINGAALAESFSILMWNLLMAICSVRRLGIHPTVLGIIRFRRR